MNVKAISRQSWAVIRLLKFTHTVRALSLPVFPCVWGQVADSRLPAETSQPAQVNIESAPFLFRTCASVETDIYEWLTNRITDTVRLITK